MKISFIQTIKKFNKLSIKYYYHKLLNLKSTPAEIAFSIALGVFIGLLFPIGLQTLIAVPISIFLGSNVLLTVTATLVSNPITILPIYYAAINIGKFITRIEIDWNSISVVLSSPSFSKIINLSQNGLIVLFTGTSILALFCSIIMYFVIYKIICAHRKKKKL
ncbi:MAG TPA: DUF2062 domain-containing protein [Melioribacteraceae bacterium]|nr:DUF2062 domain-containing protein [Melioribacteraceae bacterium]